MNCRDLDEVITPFIDDLVDAGTRAATLAHLHGCASCRARVDAESAGRDMLHAHAAVARTLGETPAFRPRVFRLGQPLLVVPPVAMLLLFAAGMGFAGWWLGPASPFAARTSLPSVPLVSAVGVIGDSYCEHDHRRLMVTGERECTLGCVRAGAEFVLLTDTRIYRLRNQELPQLRVLANHRVRVEGTLHGGALQIASLTDAPATP